MHDIKQLKMENFHWAEKNSFSFNLRQKLPLSLPLTPEVGWAVIDYLKYGRPKIDSPYLFVRHIAPFGPFSEDDHLTQLIKGYMELAHLPTLKKRRGMHSLRHTMASHASGEGYSAFCYFRYSWPYRYRFDGGLSQS